MPAPGRRRPRRTAAFLLMSVLLCSDAGFGDIYKWVDEAGRVHYGDAKPRDHSSRIIETAPAPSAQEVLRARGRLDGLSDPQRSDEDEKKRRAQEQAAAREAAVRKVRCRDARRALSVLEMDRPVYDIDEQGGKVYLADDERATRIKGLRKSISADCR